MHAFNKPTPVVRQATGQNPLGFGSVAIVDDCVIRVDRHLHCPHCAQPMRPLDVCTTSRTESP